MRPVRERITTSVGTRSSDAGKLEGPDLEGVRLLPLCCAWCGDWIVVMDPPHEGARTGVSHGLCSRCRSQLEQSRS